VFILLTNKKQYIGAFTSENNKEDGSFATGPLEGDHFILEYFEPKKVIGLGEIEIESVIHAYRPIFVTSKKKLLEEEDNEKKMEDQVYVISMLFVPLEINGEIKLEVLQ